MSSASNKIRIGTRASNLALAQVAEVHLLLADHLQGREIEIVPITTSGDKIQDRNLADIGGKALFIKELEESLIQGKIDVAIHSAKDVPPTLHEDTYISAFTERLDAHDCLISKNFNSLEELPEGAVIGTSSARRKAILLCLRPDLNIVNFRGNVDTRLTKVNNEDVDASILASCGLERVGKNHLAKQIISKEIMLPAGGQGALAIQIKKDNQEMFDLFKNINHEKTQICIKSERAFLRELGASCATPVSVHAHFESASLDSEVVNLETMILDYDGTDVFKTESQSNPNLEDAIKLGTEAAKKTKKEAADLLKKICQ